MLARTLLPGLALALALSTAPAGAQTAPFNPEQRRAIEGIVKDYLLAHPELLQEVFAELEKRQGEAQRTAQADALQSERARLLDSSRDHIGGNPAGDVTLVEFTDYNCGFCKRALGDIKAMIKSDPKLKVVFKDFPVLGPGSVEAARVSAAARMQLKADRQFDFHTRLMETKGPVNGERALTLAKEMGLDMGRLQKDMDGADVKESIQTNVMLGDKLGLTGTPAFIVGDEVIFGAVGLEPLRKAVDNTRKCGKATC
ncbi:DsbA family protein [Salinarimonas soli]|uniref:DsbA family protein n=1 Tax=Salinarimonas soli TaxID=1638099 RepID=A0A5B2V769_9HYPH|nr:DsbA family protein [Salinarimonas soli]KAA2235333.1 DsbA family protein [Salinarimonas soli]